MAKRKRINKKKLIFVILVLVFVLYLVFRIISGIGNFIEKKRNPEPVSRVKTAEEIQEEENRKINELSNIMCLNSEKDKYTKAE